MNLRRLGGYALCISAVISLLLTLWYRLGGDNSTTVRVVALVGGILVLLGLPAIQWMQPQTGRPGQVGLALMAIGALIALGINAYSATGGSDVGDLVPLASALTGLVGDLVVGWVTMRAGIFPTWVGELLIAGGVLNFIGGLLPEGALASAMGLLDAIAIPLALIGFGLTILRLPVIATHERTGA
jgi:hypothetical protein